MSEQGLAQVMDRYSNDATFRDKIRADPQGAIRSSGIQLNEQEMEAIQSMDWAPARRAAQGAREQVL